MVFYIDDKTAVHPIPEIRTKGAYDFYENRSVLRKIFSDYKHGKIDSIMLDKELNIFFNSPEEMLTLQSGDKPFSIHK
jgi:hypothetical protein